MTQEQIACNKLIAEFLGWHLDPKRLLKYHSSWDWLMPTLKKIEDMGYNTQISRIRLDVQIGEECCIAHEDKSFKDGWDFLGRGKDKISSVYESIIKFITWYNQQSQQHDRP